MANIRDTQEVVEVAQQFAASILDTQEAVESAWQFAVSVTVTQTCIEIIYKPGTPAPGNATTYLDSAAQSNFCC